MKTFELEKWTKARPLWHVPKGGKILDAKGAEVAVKVASGFFVTNEHVTDDAGNLNRKAFDFYNGQAPDKAKVAEADVRPITRADLGAVYTGTAAKAMLTHYAETNKRNGEKTDDAEKRFIIQWAITAAGDDARGALQSKLRPTA